MNHGYTRLSETPRRKAWTPAQLHLLQLLNHEGIAAVTEQPLRYVDDEGQMHDAQVDLWLPQHRLAIEVLGNVHSDPAQRKADRERRRGLERSGIHILEFWNDEIIRAPRHVLAEIAAHIRGVDPFAEARGRDPF